MGPVGADPLVGRVLGDKIEIIRRLGSGAVGQVYLGHHRGLDKDVAVKVLHDQRDAAGTARFQREARAASRLDHPNAVRVLDFGEDGPDHLQYIVMERLEGTDLQVVLNRQRKLSAGELLEITIPVASVLAEAHAQGFVHRDIKPANIMLHQSTRQGGGRATVVKVLDFGLAKPGAAPEGLLDATEVSAPDATVAGGIVGTPGYMSPEQFSGQPLDGRSDIFSLGVVLYTGLSGQRPYRGKTLPELRLERLHYRPPPLCSLDPSIPPRLSEIVEKAMAIQPEERFQSAVELEQALIEVRDEATLVDARDLAERLPSLAPPPLAPAPPPPSPPAPAELVRAPQAEPPVAPRRPPPLRWLAGVGVLALGAAGWLWLGAGAPRVRSVPLETVEGPRAEPALTPEANEGAATSAAPEATAAPTPAKPSFGDALLELREALDPLRRFAAADALARAWWQAGQKQRAQALLQQISEEPRVIRSPADRDQAYAMLVRTAGALKLPAIAREVEGKLSPAASAELRAELAKTVEAALLLEPIARDRALARVADEALAVGRLGEAAAAVERIQDQSLAAPRIGAMATKKLEAGLGREVDSWLRKLEGLPRAEVCAAIAVHTYARGNAKAAAQALKAIEPEHVRARTLAIQAARIGGPEASRLERAAESVISGIRTPALAAAALDGVVRAWLPRQPERAAAFLAQFPKAENHAELSSLVAAAFAAKAKLLEAEAVARRLSDSPVHASVAWSALARAHLIRGDRAAALAALQEVRQIEGTFTVLAEVAVRLPAAPTPRELELLRSIWRRGSGPR